MSISNKPINGSPINVKQLRSSKKLTVRQVCAAIDVAESTVLRWEAGTMKPHLPLEKVQIMLDLFECDFTTLYAAFKQTALQSEQIKGKDLNTEKNLQVAV
jgi:transcriptional regulator with XRE-family HTH domain